MTESKSKIQAKRLRLFRKIHRFTGASLFLFFVVVSVSGLLLGWKKHSGGLILEKSFSGKSSNPQDWLPLSKLQQNALEFAQKEVSPTSSLEIDRIDVRPDKGMVKFVFVQDYWGLQLDMTTGEVLHFERRRADFIENIHDGSIVDLIFGISGGYIKLVYTSVMGLSLLTFTITGFWLWFGPKRMAKTRRAEVKLVEEDKSNG